MLNSLPALPPPQSPPLIVGHRICLRTHSSQDGTLHCAPAALLLFIYLFILPILFIPHNCLFCILLIVVFKVFFFLFSQGTLVLLVLLIYYVAVPWVREDSYISHTVCHACIAYLIIKLT